MTTPAVLTSSAPLARPGLFWMLLALFFVCACGPQEPAKNPRFNLKKPTPSITRTMTLSGPEALPAVVVAELGTADSVVHFAQNGTKGIIVVRAAGKWASGPIRISRDATDPAVEDARLIEIGPAPEVSGPVALKAHGNGFVFVWAAPASAGQEIWVAALDAKGVPIGKLRSAGRAFENVTWIDVLAPNGQPTSILIETTNNDSHTVHHTTVPRADEMPGKLGALTTLAEGAAGWQAASGPAGTAFAWVDGEPGRVRARTIDKANKISAVTLVTPRPTAIADVNVTGLVDRFLVGWTDIGSGDHHVHVAELDGSAKTLSPPTPVLHPVGGQALVTLIASEDHRHALLAWERVLGVRQTPRHIELSLLGADGKLLPDGAELDFHADEGTPYFVGDGSGFTALTMAPMLQKEEKVAEPLIGPVFVRFGATLGTLAAEPIRVAELKHQAVGMEGVPRLVQGLNCVAGLCSLLATGEGQPSLMAWVALPVRGSRWRAPSRKRPVATPPLVAGLSTLADVDEPIADIATTVLADGRTLVAWVTHALPDPNSEDDEAPATATLAFRFVDDEGPGPIQVLSTRAISVGGVDVLALPAAAAKQPVALIGWAGPANGPQVYATLIDADGGKARQKTVTQVVRRKGKKGSAPNEVYDIDVASDGHDNFLFAWSDSRDDNPEIYVARLSQQLQKNVRDQRITAQPGPSIEPHLAVTPAGVLLTWSDAEEGQRADIVVAELDDKTLAVRGKPRRVEASPAHSRTPRWVGDAGSLALSWLDEDRDDVPAALRLVAVDSHGEAITAARRIRTSSGTVTSRWVACEGPTCRGILVASDGALLEVGLFSTERESGAPVSATVSTMLDGGSKQDLSMVGPTASADVVLFVHDGGRGGRIRRLDLTW